VNLTHRNADTRSEETMWSFNGIGTTIYGQAKRQDLAGAARTTAEQAGYLPRSYQAVKWFTFLFLPVVPLGTYRVMKAKQGFWTTEYPQFAMQPVSWDWGQVARHYAIAYAVPVLLLLAVVLGG
jgi:hypothetical protein